jgi:Transposase domain (DUF772)
VVPHLLVLKHIRNLSYGALEREVRANLVYRDFTRVGGGKMPDAKTMGRWGLAIGPQVLRQIHDRMVRVAQDNGVIAGGRMRVDTTVVESNIHHPTDSTLLGDGVRVLIRTMKKITDMVGAVGTKLRDRSRRVKLRLFEIARIARPKARSIGTDCSSAIADCSRPRAESSGRRTDSRRKYPRASSGQRTSCSRSRWRGCVRSSTEWCLWCGG